MDQYIGRMLDDRYEILELIGSGRQDLKERPGGERRFPPPLPG